MDGHAGPTPPLSLAHVTLAATDLEGMLEFYVGTLGFQVTNRGVAGDGAEMAFISQDPLEHHQIVLISGLPAPERQFVMVDHLAFRAGTLDDLRRIGERLSDAGVEDAIPISHGNAWSLYFTDPEGNGLECFVDTPFHVAQPHAGGLDLGTDDATIEATTRGEIESLPEFGPLDEWQEALADRLRSARKRC